VSEDLAEGIFRVTCLLNNTMSSQEVNLMFTSHLISSFLFLFSAVGDTVAEDEVVLEIETDKVGFYLHLSCLFLFIYYFVVALITQLRLYSIKWWDSY
jgi:hypothetical protein